jgi:acyl carrier protein
MALVAGWQRFDDHWREEHPLVDPDRWTAVLRETGFTRADFWPRRSSPATILGQHVLVAQTLEKAAVEFAAAAATPRAAAPVPSHVPAMRVVAHQHSDSTPAERRAQLLDVVRAEVTRVLRLPPGQSPSSRLRLMELGIDSLMAVELRDRLRSALGLEEALSATLVFDYPTIAAIADYLSTLIEPAPGAAAEFNAARAEAIALLDDDAVAELVDARLRDLEM